MDMEGEVIDPSGTQSDKESMATIDPTQRERERERERKRKQGHWQPQKKNHSSDRWPGYSSHRAKHAHSVTFDWTNKQIIHEDTSQTLFDKQMAHLSSWFVQFVKLFVLLMYKFIQNHHKYKYGPGDTPKVKMCLFKFNALSLAESIVNN